MQPAGHLMPGAEGAWKHSVGLFAQRFLKFKAPQRSSYVFRSKQNFSRLNKGPSKPPSISNFLASLTQFVFMSLLCPLLLSVAGWQEQCCGSPE
ncbi:uncharacterized [Tachysurus ichikawai]